MEYQGIITVSQEPGAGCTSIGEALDQAPEGGRILLKPGRYEEELVISRSVEIVGDGPAEEIVLQTPSNNCIFLDSGSVVIRGVTIHKTEDPDEYFAVCVLPDGNLLLENCILRSDSGNCLGVRGEGAHSTARNCRFFNGAKKGVYVDARGHVTLEECELTGFIREPAVGAYRGGQVDIRRTKIHGGGSPGVLAEGGTVFLTDCELQDFLRSPAIYAQDGGEIIVRRSKVEGGMIFGEVARGTVEDSDLSSREFPCIWIDQDADPVIRRCRIHDSGDSGVRVSQNGKGTMEFCEFYGFDQAPAIWIYEGGDPRIRQCSIRDGGHLGIAVTERGFGTLEECRFHDFDGREMEISGDSNPRILQCRFINEGRDEKIIHREREDGIAGFLTGGTDPEGKN